MANPIPLTTDGTGPAGAIPVSISGPAGAVESVNGKTGKVVLDAEDVGALPDDYVPSVDPVVQALITAGFGTAGQVLATNATADGFEWVTP